MPQKQKHYHSVVRNMFFSSTHLDHRNVLMMEDQNEDGPKLFTSRFALSLDSRNEIYSQLKRNQVRIANLFL